jgi:LDH2 family malate/lactate/ureidoglycolate dehydrogenase
MIFPREALTDFAVKALEVVGVSPDHAKRTAAALVFADLRGVASHGMAKLPIYVRRIMSGAIDPQAQPGVVSGNAVLAVVDGKNALGPVAGGIAADRGVAAAGKYGMGVTLVRNSNHFGAAAYYAMAGLEAGMIGFAFSNTNPVMAPWGGKQALIGTNPLAVAVPSGQGLPIVLDMAASAAARGKIVLAAEEGKQLPAGWAFDRTGRETRDPHAALEGLLAPLGGAKGSGIAVIIDIIAGVLAQSAFLDGVRPLYTELDQPQRVGHCIGALRIADIMPLPEFLTAMDQYIATIKACPAVEPNRQVCLPGEIEYYTSLKYDRDGIPMADTIQKELNELACRLGIGKL